MHPVIACALASCSPLPAGRAMLVRMHRRWESVVINSLRCSCERLCRFSCSAVPTVGLTLCCTTVALCVLHVHVVCCLLPSARRLLPVVYRMLPFACCVSLLSVAWLGCILSIACCVLHLASCMLLIVSAGAAFYDRPRLVHHGARRLERHHSEARNGEGQ